MAINHDDQLSVNHRDLNVADLKATLVSSHNRLMLLYIIERLIAGRGSAW